MCFVSVALFSGIHQEGIADGQENGLFGSPPDGITVSTTTSIFEDSNSGLQTTSSIPIQLVPVDVMTGGGTENVPSSAEKVP